MKGRVFIILVLFLYSCKAEKKEHPNIIFIMMDDLGYGQSGLYNQNLSTDQFDPYFTSLVKDNEGYDLQQAIDFSKQAMPTMHKLAEEGVVFNRAFTSSSLCAPSRIGIATGILQNRLGIYRNLDCESRGIQTNTHLAEIIKAKGYATAHIGKWHIGRRNEQLVIDALQTHDILDTIPYRRLKETHPIIFKELFDGGYYGSVVREDHPLNHGFDYYLGYNTWASQFYNSTLVWENYDHVGRQKGYNTDVFTDTAIAFISKQLAKERPFYVQLHYHAVHDSLQPQAPSKYFNQFQSGSYELNNFYAHVYAVDQNIRRIIDFLKKHKVYENTLIVFTSDNGAQAGGPSVLPGNAPFSGHKGTYFQGGIRVPFVVHWPAQISDSRRSDMLVSTLDILPTAIDAIGGEVPVQIDGRSLLPYLKKENNDPVHEYLVWAGLHSRAWGFLIHKSFRNHGNERNHAPPAWVVIKDNHLLRFTGEIEADLNVEDPMGRNSRMELFDIGTDPAELTNVSDEFPGIMDDLRSIYVHESSDFLPPTVWNKSKWNELKSSNLQIEYEN